MSCVENLWVVVSVSVDTVFGVEGGEGEEFLRGECAGGMSRVEVGRRTKRRTRCVVCEICGL